MKPTKHIAEETGTPSKSAKVKRRGPTVAMQTITAKSLMSLLRRANKSRTLDQITRLYAEQCRLREAATKLKERRAKIAQQIKEACAVKEPHQFTFNF